mgnify:CR=1 FL=1
MQNEEGIMHEWSQSTDLVSSAMVYPSFDFFSYSIESVSSWITFFLT